VGARDPMKGVPDPPLRVRHLITIRCEAYARILHPLQVSGATSGQWGWQRLAGHPLRADDRPFLRDFLHSLEGEIHAKGLTVEPMIGSPDRKTVLDLARILKHGADEEQAYFYFWNGRGFSSGRSEFVYSGSVTLASGFFANEASLFEAPNLWWGLRHDWFVASDGDATSTYVGATATVIKEILRSSELEAFEVDVEAEVDEWPRAGSKPWPPVDH
jgi:hypothetical protein